MLLRSLLAHPLTRDMDLNDPRLTELRREVIRSKPFLLKIYRDWYSWIAAGMPAGPGAVLELGAGAGFLAEYIPGLVTSEVFFCRGVSVVADGQQMPFATASLRAIVFTDVLHHLPDVRLFFREAARCLRPGGRVIMIEPWVSAWSSFIYPRLHHERYDPSAPTWEFPSSGPLSGSNQALPWIIFSRDRMGCLPGSAANAAALPGIRWIDHTQPGASVELWILEMVGRWIRLERDVCRDCAGTRVGDLAGVAAVFHRPVDQVAPHARRAGGPDAEAAGFI